MSLLNWLQARFAQLSSLLDTWFQPLVNIATNVVSWIVTSGVQTEGRANNFTRVIDSVRATLTEARAQFLHILGLQDTTFRVGDEAFKRSDADIKIGARQTTDKADLELRVAKEKLELQENAVKESLRLQTAQEQGDLSNRTLIEQLGDVLSRFKGDFEGWFTSFGETLTLFARDPLGFIASLLFEVVLDIVLWEIASGLARPGLNIGVPPRFGGADQGVIGGGVGGLVGKFKLIMPLQTVYGLGLTYNQQTHPGYDFIGKENDSVFSAQEGKVTKIIRGDAVLGNVVGISGGRLATFYAGLKTLSVNVEQPVTPKTRIGSLGLSIHGKQNALHFEARVDFVHIDPLPILEQRP